MGRLLTVSLRVYAEAGRRMTRLSIRNQFQVGLPEADVRRLGVAIAGPLLTQKLAVPPWIRLGDTPDGQPAIWWKAHPSRNGRPQWTQGGRADQAFWHFLELAGSTEADDFLRLAQRFGPLGLWPYETPDRHKVFGLDYWVPSAP
jgi:hypothetical protein